MVCKDGIKFYDTKIKFILDLKPLVNPKQVRSFLGNYKKFIRHLTNITFPMDELLRVNVSFIWSKECIESFETLKRQLGEAFILRFPNWKKKFHVHINASIIAVSAILTQPREITWITPIHMSIER